MPKATNATGVNSQGVRTKRSNLKIRSGKPRNRKNNGGSVSNIKFVLLLLLLLIVVIAFINDSPLVDKVVTVFLTLASYAVGFSQAKP